MLDVITGIFDVFSLFVGSLLPSCVPFFNFPRKCNGVYRFRQIFIKNRKSENRDLYEEWRPWHVKYSLTSTAPFINSSHGRLSSH